MWLGKMKERILQAELERKKELEREQRELNVMSQMGGSNSRDVVEQQQDLERRKREENVINNRRVNSINGEGKAVLDARQKLRL